MATGGGFPRLKQSKSETKQRSSNWPRSVSSDKDDSLSLTSFPSDIRINNWDLSDLRPAASADSRRRKKSKGNPEREREQSLSVDSPPRGESKQRTPASLSRTRNTPTAQRDALEKLKQKLTYDEEQYSTDGERNNERSLARGRRRPVNNRETEGGSGGGRRPRSNRNSNTEHLPDRNQIVGRLVQIQDYIKQATSMMETLQKSGDSGNTEDLTKVGRLIANLHEQEQGYFNLLHTNAAIRSEALEAGIDGLPAEGTSKRDFDSEDSVDLEVESNASETTENTTSSSSRPRIEDKLGLGSEEEGGSDDSKDEDTALDNTVISQASVTAQAVAARNVAETINSLTRESENSTGATGGGDLTSQQRQHLMRIMMEKQEQLRQLQSRQDQLLNMKKEAELRLQQAQARDNQARAALESVEAGRAFLEENEDFLDQAEGQLKSNIVGYPESGDDEAANAREADPLTEIHRQLSFLRNEFSAESGRRPPNNTEGSSGGAGSMGGSLAAVALGQQQQQQLQDKLKDLQQKKQSMDQILARLVKSHCLQVMNNEASSATRPLLSPQQKQPPQQLPQPPSASLPPPASRPMEQDMASMLMSLGNLSDLMNGAGGGDGGSLAGWQASLEQGGRGSADVAITVQEAQEKLEKLREVRERLNQLQNLVQYYQKMKTQPESQNAGLQEGQPHFAHLDSLTGQQIMEEALQQGLPLPALGAGTNLSPGAAALQPDGTFLQIQEAAVSAASQEHSDEDNASASEGWASGMGTFDQDHLMQEKARKLTKAKEKLRDLRELILAMEAVQDCADVSQNSSAGQQLTGVTLPKETEGAVAEETLEDGGNISVSEGEVPPGLTSDSQSARNEGRLHQQMEELSRLRNERQKLLSLQQQLHTLQDRFVEAERESEEERRPAVSIRKGDGDGMQPPSTSVVTFASNDELYSKMRDQRIEREELRSKKKELEAIMKKDQNRRQYFRNQDNQSDTVSYTTGTDAFGASASADATMATWGGSTVDNLENITEDEDRQNGNTRAEEEDDGFPSDGIVQVEEEEEENETDNGTYTISNDARHRNGTQLGDEQCQGARPKTSRLRRGFPQPVKPTGNKKVIKRPQSQPWGRVLKEDRLQNKLSQQRISPVAEDGVDKDVAMKQFRQQVERMSSLCRKLMNSQTSSCVQPASKMKTQLATVSPPAEGTTPTTQSDVQFQMMRELQQQQLMLAVNQCNQQLMMQQFDMATLHRQLQQLTGQMSTIQQSSPTTLLPRVSNPVDLPPTQQGVLMSQPYLSPLSSTLAAHVPNNVSTSVNVQSSRQTTFTVNPNFTSNPFSDQQHFPVSQAVQTTGLDHSNEECATQGRPECRSGGSFPRPVRLWEEACEPDDKGPHSLNSQQFPKMNLQAFLRAHRKKNSQRHNCKNPIRDPTAELEREGGYRPGLSAGISGAGFDDRASFSSLSSSQAEGAVVHNSQTEPGELGELNLFEELRETIYTEVATLISQNESRPQYLLQLFTDLQTINTDIMRRRTIFALQEIAQTSLVKPKTTRSSEQQAWRPWKSDQDNLASEMTPSESVLTSEDEEIKARVRQHASALERKKQKQKVWSAPRGGSLSNDKFDYVEAAATTSSLSTPTNNNGESPFSRDSLGDTVIHLDKALARMRREMQQVEQVRNHHNDITLREQEGVNGDAGSREQGSESSTSDLMYPSVDAQKLHEQIKGVMSQIIPVIKEHINDVFSPQLLSYVQRLVLSLVRQPGHCQEFARFFYGQLSSILQDCLSKFEGRRVREVGEDVLLDMSDVLFNELAFLRIMRDLDNPIALEKIRRQPWFSPLSSQRTSAVLVGEDFDAGGNESDNEASDDKDDDIKPQNRETKGVDKEEEELGKAHDNGLAQKLETQTGDEKDDDIEDLPSTSAVHIQLAMSETKPFTRIGSDEDTDGCDESLSLEDPCDTAVSRNSLMEHHQDSSNAAAATPSVASTISAPSPQQQKEASTEREEKEADTSEADGTLETRGPADGCRESSSLAAASVVCSGSGAARGTCHDREEKGGTEVQVNGHIASPEEEEEQIIDLDDLPPVLTVAEPVAGEEKCQEAEGGAPDIAAIINAIDAGEELAGDGSSLKEPDSSHS